MVQLIRNKDSYGIAVFLLLVFLIGWQEYISPAIGVFILVVLTEAIFFRGLKFVFNWGLILFIGLYLIYLLGMFGSDHPDIGWKLLEYKMSFFIFPILFLFPKKSADYTIYLRGLIWGCLLLSGRFVFESYLADSSFYLYDVSRQQLGLHPTYVAIYYSTAILFLVYSKQRGYWNLPWLLIAALIGLFSLFIFAAGSFAGILFLGILVAAGIGYLIKRYLNLWSFLIYLISVPFLIYASLTFIKSLAYDLEVLGQVKDELAEGKKSFLEKNKTQTSGTRERIMLWYISSEIISENPFGVGTGDIDYFLQAKCEKYDLKLLKDQNLNPHNQYLQIGIDLGVAGMIYLLGILIWLFIQGIRSSNWMLSLTVLSLGFNALFESVLQRQSGIVFYTLILTLLLLVTNSKSKDKEIV